MKFKEFFQKQIEHKKRIIREMSLRNDDNENRFDILNDLFKNKEFTVEIRNKGDHISTETIGGISDIEIWEYSTNSPHGLKFILGDTTLASVEYIELNGNVIQIVFINAFRQQRGILANIFIDYLLSHIDEIFSDNIQTTSAFYFYRNLFRRKDSFSNKFEMYLKNVVTGEERKILTEDDMVVTFGDNREHFEIAYKIKKI